jgi:hypothetical protein
MAKFTFKNGDVYEGEFENNMRHGRGKLTFEKDRSFLDGEWKNDKFVKGKFSQPTEYAEYSGAFQDGQFHGLGKLTVQTGNFQDVYEGQWVNG